MSGFKVGGRKVVRSRDYSLMERIRQQATMSQQISKKDAEYGNYSGGNYDDVKKIAEIDLIIEFNLIPAKFRPLLELYRASLIKKRKAFFATLGSTEITKLGFLIGWEDDRIHASNP